MYLYIYKYICLAKPKGYKQLQNEKSSLCCRQFLRIRGADKQDITVRLQDEEKMISEIVACARGTTKK